MATLLVVHHSPTESTERICAAAIEGANHPEIENVDVVVRQALEATIEDVLAADGYVLGTTANFGYISGALKHFFDSTYNAVREPSAGRPFGYWIHGGNDTTGAERAMTAITTGLGWSLAAEPVTFTGEVTQAHLDEVLTMAATIAATLTDS